jgi:hypothetical protein
MHSPLATARQAHRQNATYSNQGSVAAWEICPTAGFPAIHRIIAAELSMTFASGMAESDRAMIEVMIGDVARRQVVDEIAAAKLA